MKKFYPRELSDSWHNGSVAERHMKQKPRKTRAGVLLYRMVRNRMEVLLVSNGKTWSIPKGAIDDGESPRQAAARELKEEAGLKAPSSLVEIGYLDKGETERLICFLAQYNRERQPRAANEIYKARFLEISVARARIQRYQVPLLDILTGLSNTA